MQVVPGCYGLVASQLGSTYGAAYGRICRKRCACPAAQDGPVDAAERHSWPWGRAASQPGSQHVELAAWRGWVEAVLDQPAGRLQASQRPPRADHVKVEVDVGAVAGDDVAQVLLVSERHDGEAEQAIALARLGPVDHAGDLVTGDEHVGDLKVAVREHRCPRPERSLGNLPVARDQVGGKDAVRDEPLAFAVELRCDL